MQKHMQKYTKNSLSARMACTCALLQVDCGTYVGTSSVDYMKLAIAQRNNQLRTAPSSTVKGGITPYSATGT
jgi:hypothetical protein